MDREYTGNAYVFIPFIDRVDAAIRAINVAHRGLDALIEWRPAQWPDYGPEPLLRPHVRVGGADTPITNLRWERLDGWIPHAEGALGRDLRIAITFCAPAGYEAFARGLIVRIVLENRGGEARDVEVALEGQWLTTLRCVATTRPLRGTDRLIASPGGDGFALEAGEGELGAALAVVAGDGADRRIRFDGESPPEPGEERTREGDRPLGFSIARGLRLESRRRAMLTFAVAAGLERDGALLTARSLAAQDPGRIVQEARIEATRIGRRPAHRRIAELARRNLLFAAYTGTARAIDDDRQYPVASRFLEHGPCAVVDELDVLLGTVPALTLADPYAARELLIRMFEVYSDRAGTHLRYLAGGVLAPGFSLSRLCAYVEALDRYCAEAADPSLAGEPIVQDVLREMDDWLWGKLHRDVFLCSTDLGPSGEAPEYPYTTIDNVRAWRFARGLAANWEHRADEPPPRFRDAADEFAAAIWQHCVVEHEGATVFAGSTDLEGNAAIYDDPEGSLRWLPWLGFCTPDDPVWLDTLDLLHSPAYPLWRTGGQADGLASRESNGNALFAALCAQLVTPQRERALATLAKLELPGGIACRRYDPATGARVEGPWSATHAGLLAWTLLHEDPPKRARHS